MPTDWWSTEEGAIDDHYTIGFFTASGTCTEGAAVAIGTATSGTIKCADATGVGDGFGVALRAADSGEMVPVLTQGVVKMKVSDGTVAPACVSGYPVMNSTTLVAHCYGYISAATTLWSQGGASHIFGMALQPYTTTADEILVLVGHHG